MQNIHDVFEAPEKVVPETAISGSHISGGGVTVPSRDVALVNTNDQALVIAKEKSTQEKVTKTLEYKKKTFLFIPNFLLIRSGTGNSSGG